MNNTDTQAIGALVLRVSIGIVLIAHGLLKVMVFTLPGTAQFFASVGFPGWSAYPVTLIEIAGGVLLISGFATRWVSLALVPVLLGATSVHLGAGWLFTNANGGWEYPAFLTAALVVQALLGPGAYALNLPRIAGPKPA
ncbi:MAG: DoxX family protein [Pseudomonadota bacterium]